VTREVKRRGTGRKPGGQPGHAKKERALLPVEQVSKMVELIPTECGICGEALKGRDESPRRRQVVELPPIVPEVTEYRCHALACRCGAVTRGELPAEARRTFGVRLSALACLLMGQYRLSKRLVQRQLSDVLGVTLSLGMVPKLGAEMAQALEGPTAEAEAYVRSADSVHADETGWYEGCENGRKKRGWLWTFAVPLVVVFRIALSRGGEVARAVLGKDFTAFLTSDRWGGYNWHDVALRQLCWSHLTRDFQGFIDRGGEGGRIGELLMRQRHRMFRLWHRVRDGTLSRESFERRMKPVERGVGRLLREAQGRAEPKTAGMAEEILKLEPALWTFVQMPQVHPTNNFAERCVRHGVLYRKVSLGTQSPQGSRFVERILTAVISLNLQKRNVLEFLADALRAHRLGGNAPSLLPSSAPALALAA
ncbi:MAG: IS66 family transposase, partial [Pyrinomonadaceae bacterium]